MDRLTPAPSFRPTRPLTRSRGRNTRPMSPSPRPSTRRPFIDPVSTTMFINTDCDYDFISSSSPDSELVFNMSPIHSHFLPSSPTREPVNVMNLRNKNQRKTESPPLSPLLYSFPRPSRLQSYMKQNVSTSRDLASRPLSSISQNMSVLSLDHRTRSESASYGTQAGTIRETRPLAASLLERSFLPPVQNHGPKDIALSNSSHSAHHIYSSSPIPIPRHSPRQSDPGHFVIHPPSPPSANFSPNFNETPLPSSGIASHVGATNTRSAGYDCAKTASPTGSPASSLRIEGFDDSECCIQETDQEQSAESFMDTGGSPSASSTAYSYSGSGPFKFSRFLGPVSNANEGSYKLVPTYSKASTSEKEVGHSRGK
ncbi:hypothetical protein K439DRAFT_66070 [Ramaria rubella]|nr:hypothetical protein K439DRAFT_66070 [Ramaria rubella]